MLGGVLLGYILRSKSEFFMNHLQKAILVIICLLLFLLGVEIGFNDTIIKNFSSIGVDAFVITLGAVLGSALAAAILWKAIVRANKNNS